MAVGMVFLPRTDLGAQERCRIIVESEILKFGCFVYGWRQVPVDISVIGEKANATRPENEQIMFSGPIGRSEGEFERDLYIIRSRIAKAAQAEAITDLYVCTMTHRSIIYKGRLQADKVTSSYTHP